MNESYETTVTDDKNVIVDSSYCLASESVESNSNILTSYSIDSESSCVCITPSKENTKVKALNEREWLEFMMILFGSVILAFNAGYVNGCTYQSMMGKGKPVAHITGTTTKAGVYAATGLLDDMIVNFCIILSFCFGAGISGGILSSSTFSLGLEYGPLLIIGSVLFFISSMLLCYAPNAYLGFYFAAMACGLQNALTSNYSGNIIRTTHMTGTVTDIGVVIGKYVIKGEFQELWKLKILIPLFTSFFFGGVISFYMFSKIGDFAICLSSVFFLGIGIIYSIVTAKHMDESCWRVFAGKINYIDKKFHGIKEKSIAKLKRTKKLIATIDVRSPLHIGGRTPSNV